MKKIVVFLLTMSMCICFSSCGESSSELQSDSIGTSGVTSDIKVTTVNPTVAKTFPEHPELIDVIGMTKDTATTALENRGLKVKVVEEYSDNVEKDFIIDQIPKIENGLTLNQGDEVTITVSLGKDKDKIYLNQMLYSDEKTDTKKNSFSIYDGEDYNDDKCKNALKFTFTHRKENYTEEVQKSKYSTYYINYDLDGKYKKFISGLTHDWIYDEIKIEILGDDKLLFSQGITDKSAIFDVDIDVSNIKIFTIKISGFIYGYTDTNESNIIFNNAYFS